MWGRVRKLRSTVVYIFVKRKEDPKRKAMQKGRAKDQAPLGIGASGLPSA